MIEDVKFNSYIEEVKSKSLKEKQKIVIDKLTALTVLTNKMCNELEIENNIIYNKELDDLKKEEYTEDDFAEAVLVFINSMQNSLYDFNDHLTEVLENIADE